MTEAIALALTLAAAPAADGESRTQPSAGRSSSTSPGKV
jgi:hypothetical protein